MTTDQVVRIFEAFTRAQTTLAIVITFMAVSVFYVACKMGRGDDF